MYYIHSIYSLYSPLETRSTKCTFFLHVMNQLIPTHNKLYDIRRRKPQENVTLYQETL
jgi:hypothetical protein